MTANGSAPFTAPALQMSGIDTRVLAPGERLVGRGFRCWLGGYRTGDFGIWQRCWEHFYRELGGNVSPAVMELANWVNAVHYCSLREIELLPESCPSFGRDECLAVTLVAASEHRSCPALQVCAYTLLGAENIEPALAAAHNFSRTLKRHGVSFEADLTAHDPPPVLH
jgi:hypothetical protein